jgi:hypothetical protein
MCVILVCPPQVRPDLGILQQCWKANPHGAGIAWREPGRVRWFKTNKVRDVFHMANAVPGEIVLHFRIASVGRVCNELRHPFPVSRRAGLASSGTARAVLFQNGTWPEWESGLEFAASQGYEVPKGEMSDARAAAFLCSIYGHKFLRKCGLSRWVFFGAKSTTLYGSWHRYEGISFSNMHWPISRRE